MILILVHFRVQVGWAVQLVMSIDRFIGAVQWSHDNPHLRSAGM